jgi:hypothetical protein
MWILKTTGRYKCPRPDHPKNQSLKIATFPSYSLRWSDQLTTRSVTVYTVIGSNDLWLVFTLVVKKTPSTDNSGQALSKDLALVFSSLSHLQSIRHWALGIRHQEDHFFFALSHLVLSPCHPEPVEGPALYFVIPGLTRNPVLSPALLVVPAFFDATNAIDSTNAMDANVGLPEKCLTNCLI